MAFKYVPVRPDIKKRIQELRIKWNVKTEGEVIERLLFSDRISDPLLENAVDFLNYCRHHLS